MRNCVEENAKCASMVISRNNNGLCVQNKSMSPCDELTNFLRACLYCLRLLEWLPLNDLMEFMIMLGSIPLRAYCSWITERGKWQNRNALFRLFRINCGWMNEQVKCPTPPEQDTTVVPTGTSKDDTALN